MRILDFILAGVNQPGRRFYMEILFEDAHLVLTVKTPGIPSQSDPSGQANMVGLLSDTLSVPVHCVHRLDTAVGGVMVYSKTKKAAGALSDLFQNRQVAKQYCAIVHGAGKSGILEDMLYHDKKINKSFVVKKKRNGVKNAVLEYETVSIRKELSLVNIRLKTGRAHQIRVQFSTRGMPLLGDRKYGSPQRCPIALWCYHLSFTHPFTREQISGTSMPPQVEPWTEFTDDFEKNALSAL